MQAQPHLAEILVDSTTALGCAEGTGALQPLAGAANLLRSLSHLLQLTVPLKFVHVAGHNDDPYNEVVDTLAALAALGHFDNDPKVPPSVRWAMALGTPVAAGWAWLLQLQPALRAA